MSVRRRVVSGMRPTGSLHLGHYVGVLRAWAALQRDHDCFFFAADWHALVDRREESGRRRGRTWGVLPSGAGSTAADAAPTGPGRRSWRGR
jgi:tryptophanyl-tRNA synthetase